MNMMRFYWSENVFDEFQDRVGEKQVNLLRFYEKLEMELYSYRHNRK